MKLSESRQSTRNISIAGSEDKLKELEELPVEQRAAKILDSGTVDITDQTDEIIVYELKVKTLTTAKDRVKVLRPDDGKVLVTVEISPTANETADEGGQAAVSTDQEPENGSTPSEDPNSKDQ